MIIIMLGAPGTGKGTVASMLKDELNIPHVSTGDIFRKNITEGTELGKLAQSYMEKGALVPDEVTIDLVKSRLQEDDVKNGIILDGFPRTVNQAEALDEMLKEMGKEVDLTINISTPEDELVERVANRRVCPNCKAVYNLVIEPPIKENTCNECGHELIKRKDDDENTFRDRLKTYANETSPLVEYYTNQNKILNRETSMKTGVLGKAVAKDVINYIKENNLQ